MLARTTAARQALLELTPQAPQLKTTELHCSEFYPGTLLDQYTTTHAASFGLATQLLDQFYVHLCERLIGLSLRAVQDHAQFCQARHDASLLDRLSPNDTGMQARVRQLCPVSRWSNTCRVCVAV